MIAAARAADEGHLADDGLGDPLLEAVGRNHLHARTRPRRERGTGRQFVPLDRSLVQIEVGVDTATFRRSERGEHVVLARPVGVLRAVADPVPVAVRAVAAHRAPPPARERRALRRSVTSARPRRMWLLTVPRGIPVSAAISRCVSPETTLSSRTRRRSPVSCATTSRACAASSSSSTWRNPGSFSPGAFLPREALDPLAAPPGAGGR